MNIYLIHATEGIYRGLHGMEDACIVEAENRDELESLGTQMSIEIMESYSDIEEMLLENARSEAEFREIDEEEDACEFENILNEEYAENVEYQIYQLSKEYTVEQYREMLDRYGAEEVSKYALE